MQFPHLSDTQFPNLPNVNVYQFQNNFDYTRWNEKTKIKLCNVIWNSDYTDVVKWDTNEARDAYFDSLDDVWTVELRSSARLVPDGYIKLPIPYDVMARYNYVYVDMPIATSTSQQIDYETSDGIRRWYFFINNIEYQSPNSTTAYVVLDVWTNFQNDIDITYMLLERGHAPVAFSDTEEYLQNPIANNKYLLAPDVSFDNSGITRSSEYVPFGNGEKWVCIASTCAPNNITAMGTVSASSEYAEGGTITYSDSPARYGYQLIVHGLSMGNGIDYSNARTPANVGISDGLIANNLTVYAIRATECYGNGTFFSDVITTCPQFLNTIKACFVVDGACITRGTSYRIANHTVYRCEGKKSTLLEKALEIEDFGYPEELQRFAKLYTSPYAQLEITDNDGNTYTINVEETSHMSVKSIVSVAFPYINERVYIEGIGGVGSEHYSWVDLKGNTAQLEISNSDWFKYCFDWNIPTYALYMDGETAFMLQSFNRNVKQGIRQGLVNYHNTMRSANTAYENVIDQSNVANTNTKNAAETARANAYRSANTGKVNADNSADTAHTNTYNNADLAVRTNDRCCTTQSDNLDIANAATIHNEDMGIASSNAIVGYNATMNSISTLYANNMVYYTTDIEVEKSTATTVSNSVGGLVSGGITGAQGGFLAGAAGGAAIGSVIAPGAGTAVGAAIGAVGGAVMGITGGAISAAVSAVQLGVTTNTAQSIADAQTATNSNMNAANNQTARDIQGSQNDVRRSVYTTNTTAASRQMDNSNATSRTNADDACAVTKTNATNTRNTTKTNATNTQTTSKANALDTKNVTNANANRTKSNVQANAGYTRQVATLNAKELLENGKYASMAAINDARNARPVEVCSYSGNPQADYMRTRGIQIKVKTQSDSAIRQAGDIFARYGYTLNQVWNVQETGLNLMNHFTYWKAAEIWVDDRESSNNAINNFIHTLFINGVTVWNDPTEIGRINVYDN